MKVVLQNCTQVIKTVVSERFDYQSNPEFIENHFIGNQPTAVGNTLTINVSASTNHTSDIYKVPVVKGNTVKFFICRNEQYPQVYVVDSNMVVLQAIPCPITTGNTKIEQTIDITADDAAFFVAGNLGGPIETNLPYTDTYVIRYGSIV